MARATSASRPIGARIRSGPTPPSTGIAVTIPEQGRGLSLEARHAGEHAVELLQRFTNADALPVDPLFADRTLVPPGALLNPRNGPADPPAGLEEAQQEHGVAQVGE